VLLHAREGHVELLGKVRDRGVCTPEPLQNAASGGVRERGERGIEAGSSILNHLVQYITHGLAECKRRRATTEGARDAAYCGPGPVYRLCERAASGPDRQLDPDLAAEPLERLYADLELSGREDLNLRPFGPETAWALSQAVMILRKLARRLQTGKGRESRRPSRLQKKPKILLPDLLPKTAIGSERKGPGFATEADPKKAGCSG
jgi:hypothetical protein